MLYLPSSRRRRWPSTRPAPDQPRVDPGQPRVDPGQPRVDAPARFTERPTGPSSRGPGRLAALDGLRLVAALMVVFYHYVAQGDLAWDRKTPEIFGAADRFTGYGWLGVELFFVISGFVICMSGWGRSIGDFFVSRAVRLYPAYWFAIVAITVAVAIAPVLQTRMVSSEILINLTMLQYPVGVPGVSAVFWTLWMELHFYLLFGLAVVWRGATYRRVVAFCALWTVASVLAEAIRDPRVNWVVEQQYSPFFIGGVVIYLMYRYRPNALLWGLLGVSWALALLRSVALTKDAKGTVGYELSWRPTAVIVTLAFLLVAVVTLWPRIAGVKARWLTVAGAMTYPLYLLHLEIGWLLIRVLRHSVPAWPLVISLVAGMLLLSYGVNRFVERPASRWMRRVLRTAMADLRDPDAVERRRAPAGPESNRSGSRSDPVAPRRPAPAESASTTVPSPGVGLLKVCDSNVVRPLDAVDPTNAVDRASAVDPPNAVDRASAVDPLDAVDSLGTVDRASVVDPLGAGGPLSVGGLSDPGERTTVMIGGARTE